MLACVKCFSLPKCKMSKALGAYTWSRSKVLTHKILQLSWSRGAGVQVQATAPFGASQFNLKMRGSDWIAVRIVIVTCVTEVWQEAQTSQQQLSEASAVEQNGAATVAI